MGIYAKEQNLDNYSVFIEGDGDNPMFFAIEHLPNVLTYGKHMFTIELRDFPTSYYRLKNDSPILFEFKDSVGNIIFSDSTLYDSVNDSYICFVYIKEDPLRTYDYIHNGICTLTVLGELETKPEYLDSVNRLPDSWKGNYNYRCKFSYDIQKNQPNISPILFKESPQLTLSQSVESDSNDNNYQRNYLLIHVDKLQTYSGKVEYLDISTIAENSQTNQFNQIGQVKVEEEFETLRSPLSSGSNWVGNFNLKTLTAADAALIYIPNNINNYWLTSSLARTDIQGSATTTTSGHQLGLDNGLWLDNRAAVYYTSLRKTQGVEYYTIKYNISGSGAVTVYEHSGSNGTTKSYLTGSNGPVSFADNYETIYTRTFTDYVPSSSLGPTINGDVNPNKVGEYYIQDDITINDAEHNSHYNQKYYTIKIVGKNSGIGAPAGVSISNISFKTKRKKGINPNFYIHKEDLGNG